MSQVNQFDDIQEFTTFDESLTDKDIEKNLVSLCLNFFNTANISHIQVLFCFYKPVLARFVSNTC